MKTADAAFLRAELIESYSRRLVTLWEEYAAEMSNLDRALTLQTQIAHHIARLKLLIDLDPSAD